MWMRFEAPAGEATATSLTQLMALLGREIHRRSNTLHSPGDHSSPSSVLASVMRSSMRRMVMAASVANWIIFTLLMAGSNTPAATLSRTCGAHACACFSEAEQGCVSIMFG